MEISQKDIKSCFEQKFIHFPSDIIKKTTTTKSVILAVHTVLPASTEMMGSLSKQVAHPLASARQAVCLAGSQTSYRVSIN